MAGGLVRLAFAYCVLRLASCVLRLRIAFCVLRFASCVTCVLHFASCVLRLASCVLRLASCVLRLASCATCVLHFASCVLRLASCLTSEGLSYSPRTRPRTCLELCQDFRDLSLRSSALLVILLVEVGFPGAQAGVDPRLVNHVQSFQENFGRG